jgi:hypothetical protein
MLLVFSAALLSTHFQACHGSESLSIASGENKPTCTPFANTDFNGHDILPPYPPKVPTAESCCSKCAANANCVAFAFSLQDGTCYLKGPGVKPSGANQGRLSGFVNATCTCAGGAFPPPCWNSPPPCSIGPGPSPGPTPPPGSRKILSQYRCLKGSEGGAKYKHCDGSKSIEERVGDIVGNLTANEMIDVILKRSVDRLEIPAYAVKHSIDLQPYHIKNVRRINHSVSRLKKKHTRKIISPTQK